MFPTWEVELVRSMYSSSSRPSSRSAIRHSSPSETLISISFAMHYSVVEGGAARPLPRRARSSATGNGRSTALQLFLSKSLGDDLSRFFAQEMHHLSFAVEAHDAARDLFRVLERRRADNLFDLRDVR